MKVAAAFVWCEYHELLKSSISLWWFVVEEWDNTRLRYKINNKLDDKKKLKILNEFWHRYKTMTSSWDNIAIRLTRTNNNIYIYISDSYNIYLSNNVFKLANLFSNNVKKKYGLS